MIVTSITIDHINALIAKSLVTSVKLGRKTTVVHMTLPNGFELVETSGCVDPSNYDHDLGIKTCMKRIVDKVWLLEGYRLQCELYESE